MNVSEKESLLGQRSVYLLGLQGILYVSPLAYNGSMVAYDLLVCLYFFFSCEFLMLVDEFVVEHQRYNEEVIRRLMRNQGGQVEF